MRISSSQQTLVAFQGGTNAQKTYEMGYYGEL